MAFDSLLREVFDPVNEQMHREPFSTSTNGEAIHITGTSSDGGLPANLIHTVTGKGYDKIFLWLANSKFGSVVVTMEWTVAGVTGDVKWTVPPASGSALANRFVNDLLLRNGATIKIYADTTEKVNVYGYIERFE